MSTNRNIRGLAGQQFRTFRKIGQPELTRKMAMTEAHAHQYGWELAERTAPATSKGAKTPPPLPEMSEAAKAAMPERFPEPKKEGKKPAKAAKKPGPKPRKKPQTDK